MNKFESKPEPSYDEYKYLIEYYEKIEADEKLKPKEECAPHIEEFEELIAPLLKKELLDILSAIETEEEALNNKERESAKKDIIPVVAKLRFLRNRTNITKEEYEKVETKYKTISNAVGMINGGLVDHNR